MRKVRYLCISDIHLGHSRTSTKDIVQSLHRYFDDYSNRSIFSNIDIIFIVGDLFDQLIDVSSHTLYEILEFLIRLIGFCERHHIKLRVLEGTPSHDRQQSRIVEAVSTIKKTTADVKWIKTLSVEFIEDLELSILYVPDEYTSSTETTLQLVKDLFREKEIDQVDIAQMHGMFTYQMCHIPGRYDTYDESVYLGMVRHFINIGHIHTSSHYERILAQGSFDRLAHGEEEPKGGMLMTIRDDGLDSYEFIENQYAKIFKTIEMRYGDLERSLNQIDRQLKGIPNESYVRIKAHKLHPIFLAFSEIKKRYLFIHFSKLSLEEEQIQENESTGNIDYVAVEIRPENIVDMIMEEIHPLQENDRKKLKDLLVGMQKSSSEPMYPS